jgi:cobalamin biosynthesis Mg chelatase CobN
LVSCTEQQRMPFPLHIQGESVAMVLHMVGAAPVREGTGRIARFELVHLEELGRPRVDVLCNMSGIFRDSFQVFDGRVFQYCFL